MSAAHWLENISQFASLFLRACCRSSLFFFFFYFKHTIDPIPLPINNNLSVRARLPARGVSIGSIITNACSALRRTSRDHHMRLIAKSQERVHLCVKSRDAPLPHCLFHFRESNFPRIIRGQFDSIRSDGSCRGVHLHAIGNVIRKISRLFLPTVGHFWS